MTTRVIDRARFDQKTGKLRLPWVIQKVCTHGSGPELPARMRGDMARDTDTYAGQRADTYVCLQCGNTKPAKELLELWQQYILTGQEFCVGRPHGR